MKYAAFIPLRGGSKSIPGKNIRPIGGKPLCQWTIEAAAHAARIDRVFVATDSDEIRAVVERLGLSNVEAIGRSAETATDTASTESAMLEFARAHEFEHLVLIQATSPLLRASDLDAAIEQYEQTGAGSLVSVVPQKRFIWSLDAAGVATPQNYVPKARPRRQDFDAYFVENGAFYISERNGFLESECRLFGTMSAFVMAEETFHELDEPVDWTILEAFLRERGQAAVSPGAAASSRASADAEPPLSATAVPFRREILPVEELRQRIAKLKLVLSDVDGVLTDSGMYYSESGDELKKFNTRDGKAFELLREAGFKVGIITAEDRQLNERRAQKMKLDFLAQGKNEKMPALDAILAETGLSYDQVAYIGDDLGDVDVLEAVGFAACPSDATPEARARAHFVCSRRGGEGCVRELAEYLLGVR